MLDHPVVSQEEWLTARKALLLREKEVTHLRDSINADRLALPWVRVEKQYTFDTPEGKKSFADLFEDRSQLIVYHFMLGPGWKAGCPGCSFICDHFEGTLPHLNHHDVTLTAISRAPMSEITAYKTRMGWRFPWASSNGSDFNYDYRVSFTEDELAGGRVDYNFTETPMTPGPENTERHGLSSFYRDEDSGEIFHTYSSYARGHEELLGTLMILDTAPKGRNEGTTGFMRRHDEYEDAPKAHACCSAAND
jgi:predicted dithiol-disulfide oxidoreductase (DUF899 family)